MAPRARGKTYWLAAPATGGPLQVVPAPTVNVRNAANTANITDTIYAADDPDATILAQGFLGNADGLIQFFTAEPQRVWLRCSKTGFTTQDIPLDVNFASNRYVPRGAWLVGTTYKFMDVVSNGGASWVALRTNTGVTPVEGADWTLVASGATLADAAPPAIAAAAAIGTSTDAAREDHTHSGSAYQAISDHDTFVGARIFHSVNQSLANATTTALALDSETLDTNGFHDPATNNPRFTIPAGKAGKYRIEGTIAFANNGTGERTASIYKNGVTELRTVLVGGAAGGTNGLYVSVSDVQSLAVNDYVDLRATQNSGGALNAFGGTVHTVFTIEYLGA